MSFNSNGMTVVVPYEVIEKMKQLDLLIKNRDRTTNTKFRLEATERLQNYISELVCGIISKELGGVGLLPYNKPKDDGNKNGVK